MPSETTRIEKKWRYWHGTPADVVRLARRVEELLESANAEEFRATVSVKHERGESSYESAAEAAEHVDGVDLETVESVHIIAGPLWDLFVVINFFKTGPFLKVEGKGDHHLAVAGIAEDLSAELDRGNRSYAHQRAISITLATAGSIGVTGAIATT